MNKKVKGEYGYLSYRRKIESIKTFLYFLIPLALFFAGLITTKTEKNLLTLVAVLGILPASKNAVLLIMYLKSHGCSEADHTIITSTVSKVEETVGKDMMLLEDMIFTTQDVTFEVPAMILYCGSVLGYLSPQQVQRTAKRQSRGKKDLKQLERELEKHLENSLKKESVSANIKIFDGIEPFTRRILELKPLEKAGDSPNKSIARVFGEISL